jgi:hypothetical protein
MPENLNTKQKSINAKHFFISYPVCLQQAVWLTDELLRMPVRRNTVRHDGC